MKYAAPPAMKFPWRFVIYGAVVLYLFGDLYLWHGPMRRHVESRRNPPPEAVGPLRWVATVNGKPITAAEIDRGLEVYLWRRGKEVADISGQNLKLMRLAVREELIARRLISTYAHLNPVEFDSHAANVEFERFRSRLDQDQDEDDYATRLELQRLNEKRLREQFSDEALETMWIDAKTASARKIDGGEVRAFFESDPDAFQIPKRIRAAHVFRVTHGQPEKITGAAEEILQEAKRRIVANEVTFAEVAKEVSEDERTKSRGGDLGVMTKKRLPPQFAEKVFSQKVGVLGEPFRSEIGWHLVRVDEHLPARAIEFEEVAHEIRAFLESGRRREVVAALLRERKRFARIRLFPIDDTAE